MKTTKNTVQEHLEAQRDYVKAQQLVNQREVAAQGGGSGLVDEKMLAETMRSVRYNNEASAVSDLIDNSIESGATQVHIAYKVESGTKIEEIAVLDDASGIDETFLPYCTKWGGSSNQDGVRNLFGRFGFGLPSASVNRGRAYDVYSRTEGVANFKKVSIDLDNLISENGLVELPERVEEDLPEWINDYAANHFDDVDSVRTVIVWRKLDRLEWKNTKQSAANFKENLGITYASWLDVVKIFIDGEEVEPVDTLFTTDGYRWYEMPGYASADPQSSIKFNAADEEGEIHEITIRISYLGIDAWNAKEGNSKVRQRVRKQHNGLVVTRNGRYIETCNKVEKMTFDNYGAQVGVNIDFPPALDSLFGITPDKQSVIITSRLWDMLETHGVFRAFNALKKRVTDERKEARRKADVDSETGVRPSEVVIGKVLESGKRGHLEASEESITEGARNLERKVKEIAAETGISEENIREAREKLHNEQPYRVAFTKGHEDDPFYRPTMEGIQMVLEINTGHLWYQDVYSKLEKHQAELRSALETMLFVLAQCEIDAHGEKRNFYRSERRIWSDKINLALEYHPIAFSDQTRKEVAEEEVDAESVALEQEEEKAE